jgi:hypothetical protein
MKFWKILVFQWLLKCVLILSCIYPIYLNFFPICKIPFLVLYKRYFLVVSLCMVTYSGKRWRASLAADLSRLIPFTVGGFQFISLALATYLLLSQTVIQNLLFSKNVVVLHTSISNSTEQDELISLKQQMCLYLMSL